MSSKKHKTIPDSRDGCSYSNVDQVATEHLELHWSVDFSRKVIVGQVFVSIKFCCIHFENQISHWLPAFCNWLKTKWKKKIFKNQRKNLSFIFEKSKSWNCFPFDLSFISYDNLNHFDFKKFSNDLFVIIFLNVCFFFF